MMGSERVYFPSVTPERLHIQDRRRRRWDDKQRLIDRVVAEARHQSAIRESMARDTKLFENIPMQINLSMPADPRDGIGWASAERQHDGRIKIEIVLDKDSSERLTDLNEVFKLWSIGFTGIARKPETIRKGA